MSEAAVTYLLGWVTGSFFGVIITFYLMTRKHEVDISRDPY